MKSNLIILKLFFKSSNWLLKLSFIALPLAFLLSITSFLFIDNLLASYQKYLITSYVGVQGRLSIESKDEKFIKEISKYAKENNLIFSIRKEYKRNVYFQNSNNSILKFANFISLDKNYLNKKFNVKVANNTIFVNKVFANSLGSLDIYSFDTIYIDRNRPIKVKIKVVDTGFLGTSPMIFISSDLKIFNKPCKISIEFLKFYKNIKLVIKNIAKKNKVLSYQIHDIINDTKETKELFNKIHFIQIGITSLLVLLSLGIIILSISIFIEFKKHSLHILQLIGMSKRDLGVTIFNIVVLTVNISLILSIYCIELLRKWFLKIIDINNFFIPLNKEEVLIIFFGGIILSFLAFIFTQIIFEGNR